MAYDLYPAVDEQYAFPPEIRQALAVSMELRNTVVPMTTAVRNNLMPAELWDGRLIANTTTDHTERYDAGTAQWVQLVQPGDVQPAYVPPSGVINQFAGTTAPPGWLLCQGQTVSRVTYAALFAVCSTRYGIGDGTANTFSLPDMRSRFPAGLHPTDTPFNVLGGVGGLLAHLHALGDTGWAKLQMRASAPQILARSVNAPTFTMNIAGTVTLVASETSLAPVAGIALGGQTNNADHTPPYLTLNYIIKT